MTEPAEVLRRAPGAAGGEVVLRVRRLPDGPEVYELIVDGVFAMDTVHTTSERVLASAVLGRLSGDRVTAVVGGLGLGCTVGALLDDPRVAGVDVVELEPSLVDWLTGGVIPGVDGVLRDPRVRLHTGDVRDLVPTMSAGSSDCLLLDVDNGPLFLVHGTNASVYSEPFLRSCLDLLRPGGVLAVWSADHAPGLQATLTGLAGSCEEMPLSVDREGRTFSYALYLARR